MSDFIATQAKMFLCLVGRHRSDKLVAVAKTAGARGATIALGQSLGNSKFLQALALDDVANDLIFMIMGREREAIMRAVRDAALKDPQRLGGMAVVVDIPQFFLRAAANHNSDTLLQKQDRSETMQSGYKLIAIIVNAGFGNDVMVMARKAGASGGTVLNAHGTGTEEDVKFFGITLVPEKEMLLIVAEEAKVDSIVKAIEEVPQLSEPGGGIAFTMNVEEFILLGKQKTWTEG